MNIRADLVLTGTGMTRGRRDGEVHRVVKRQLVAGGLYLEGEVARATPFGVTGKMRRGWQSTYVKRGSQASEVLVSNATEYVLPVELGRRPGTFIPLKPLQLWARRKLGADEGRAWGIARKISRKAKRSGIKGQRFAEKTFDESIDVLNRNFLFPVGAQLVKVLS